MFSPPVYLRNAHLQTVLNSLGPRRLRAGRLRPRLGGVETIIEADDGTRLRAEFDPAPEGARTLVVLLHGWEGCSWSSYMIITAHRLNALGCDVLRLNLRDHGDSHHLNRELFNSPRSPEVASALANFLAPRDYTRACLVGFSLGASFALRVAADRGAELGLDRVLAVCPPVDPARVMDALNRGFFGYERYFFRRWRDSLRRKLACFPELGYGELLAGARSLDDLNRIFVPRHTPYRRVEDYFAAYGLYGDRLKSLPVPARIIAAADDPIIPVGDFGRIEPVAALEVDIQPYGGHCGFIETPTGRSWLEREIPRRLGLA